MSHFTVLVCLPKDTDRIDKALAEALAPFDENTDVEPYRNYEEGGPEDYWWVSSVRRGAAHHRDGTGIEPHYPDDPHGFKPEHRGSSRYTEDEQRAELADDAVWAERLGEHPTWEDVVRLYNEKYHPADALALAGDSGDDERLLYDPESGRAYTMSRYNPDTYGLVLCPGGQGSKEDQSTWEEVLRAVRAHKKLGRVSDSAAEPRRSVHLLHSLHPGAERGADAGTQASVAPLAEVSDDTRAVRPSLVSAGRQVRDLPITTDDGGDGYIIGAPTTPADPLAGGSLPSDWEGARASLLSLQRDVGAGGGPAVVAHCGGELSHEPHIRAKGLIGGSRWDWWVIGGRWRWSMLARRGVDRSALILTELRGGDRIRTNQMEIDERIEAGLPLGPDYGPNGGLWCDGAPRGLLDFEAKRDKAVKDAHAEFDAWEAFWNGLPAEARDTGRSWSHFRGLAKAGVYTSDEARERYHKQPWVTAIKAQPGRSVFGTCELDRYGLGRDEFVARARLGAVPGYALLTLEGEWMEPGQMGWFAMTTANDDSREAYHIEANRYLDELDPEAWIVLVDAHI